MKRTYHITKSSASCPNLEVIQHRSNSRFQCVKQKELFLNLSPTLVLVQFLKGAPEAHVCAGVSGGLTRAEREMGERERRQRERDMGERERRGRGREMGEGARKRETERKTERETERKTERERERDREKDRERQRGRERKRRSHTTHTHTHTHTLSLSLSLFLAPFIVRRKLTAHRAQNNNEPTFHFGTDSCQKGHEIHPLFYRGVFLKATHTHTRARSPTLTPSHTHTHVRARPHSLPHTNEAG